MIENGSLSLESLSESEQIKLAMELSILNINSEENLRVKNVDPMLRERERASTPEIKNTNSSDSFEMQDRSDIKMHIQYCISDNLKSESTSKHKEIEDDDLVIAKLLQEEYNEAYRKDLIRSSDQVNTSINNRVSHSESNYLCSRINSTNFHNVDNFRIATENKNGGENRVCTSSLSVDSVDLTNRIIRRSHSAQQNPYIHQYVAHIVGSQSNSKLSSSSRSNRETSKRFTAPRSYSSDQVAFNNRNFNNNSNFEKRSINGSGSLSTKLEINQESAGDDDSVIAQLLQEEYTAAYKEDLRRSMSSSGILVSKNTGSECKESNNRNCYDEGIIQRSASRSPTCGNQIGSDSDLLGTTNENEITRMEERIAQEFTTPLSGRVTPINSQRPASIRSQSRDNTSFRNQANRDWSCNVDNLHTPLDLIGLKDNTSRPTSERRTGIESFYATLPQVEEVEVPSDNRADRSSLKNDLFSAFNSELELANNIPIDTAHLNSREAFFRKLTQQLLSIGVLYPSDRKVAEQWLKAKARVTNIQNSSIELHRKINQNENAGLCIVVRLPRLKFVQCTMKKRLRRNKSKKRFWFGKSFPSEHEIDFLSRAQASEGDIRQDLSSIDKDLIWETKVQIEAYRNVEAREVHSATFDNSQYLARIRLQLLPSSVDGDLTKLGDKHRKLTSFSSLRSIPSFRSLGQDTDTIAEELMHRYDPATGILCVFVDGLQLPSDNHFANVKLHRSKSAGSSFWSFNRAVENSSSAFNPANDERESFHTVKKQNTLSSRGFSSLFFGNEKFSSGHSTHESNIEGVVAGNHSNSMPAIAHSEVQKNGQLYLLELQDVEEGNKAKERAKHKILHSSSWSAPSARLNSSTGCDLRITHSFMAKAFSSKSKS